jgi:hypothetical protein
MENYQLVNQWAASVNSDRALTELTDYLARNPWMAKKIPETVAFIQKMAEDLPKIMLIIKSQEKQNAVLRMKNDNLNGYIKANQLADECILNDIKEKFKIEI